MYESMKTRLLMVVWRQMTRLQNTRGYGPALLTTPEQLHQLLLDLRPVEAGVSLVRLGPASDGGYLVPDDLNGITACYSPGVDAESGFEFDCAELGMDVFMADGSVMGPARDHPRFNFISKHLGLVNDDKTTTLDQWVDQTSKSVPGDLLLQMDIEGAEWGVLLNMSPELLQRFRIVVIEFHNLGRLFTRGSFETMALAIGRLTSNFHCVHVHPNNACGVASSGNITLPEMVEVTFLRRDRVGTEAPAPSHLLPHPLDADNVTHRPPSTTYDWLKPVSLSN